MIVLLRHSLVKAFKSVRARWRFSKLHTMSAFITQLPDRGMGSTYCGEAKHPYLKQQASTPSVCRRTCLQTRNECVRFDDAAAESSKGSVVAFT